MGATRTAGSDTPVVIGVDAHKRVHAAVAVDTRGRALDRWRGPNTPAGWQQLADWAAQWEQRQVAIEGAGGYGRGLAQTLVAHGEQVAEVNPRWTAAQRARQRPLGKSDRLDALAVARVAQQQDTPLPAVAAEDATSVLAVLASERESALAEATRLRNQLHALLSQLDPTYQTVLPALTTAAGVRAVCAYPDPAGDVLARTRAAAVRRLGARLALVREQEAELSAQIRALGQHYAPLTAIVGIAPLSAGLLAGILGPGQRFTHDAALARYAGVAPLEASSGERVRHRLCRSGRRELNAILERIALTQARCAPQARAYLARRRAQGKTRREAIRCLKRFIVRAIWQAWRRCPRLSLDDIAPPATVLTT